MKLSPIFALMILTAGVSASDATFPPLQRQSVLEQALPPANPPVHFIRGASIRFAPSQPSGIHRHPVSTVGVVAAGSFVFQIEGSAERILHTGDVFFEPAGQTISRFDNASSTEPSAITVFYLADSVDRALIEDLTKK